MMLLGIAVRRQRRHGKWSSPPIPWILLIRSIAALDLLAPLIGLGLPAVAATLHPAGRASKSSASLCPPPRSSRSTRRWLICRWPM
jgi:hypothetical protein